MSTVLGRVLAQARQHPQAIALRRCDGTSAVTYGQLPAVVNRLAGELRECGVCRGHRVFVMSDNGPETYVAVLACAQLGAVAVLVDRAVPAATVARFGEITGPGAVLLTPGADPAALPNTLSAIPVIAVDANEVAGHGDAAPAVAPPELGADDPLAMIFTSGTTGEPKAVLLANRTFFAVADILARENLTWISWVAGEATYSPLPASHIGGLWWILNCLMHGSECVTGGENSASLAEILNVNQIASTCLVPTLLTRLVSEVRAGAALPPLRMIGYGGSRAIAADVQFVEAAGVHTAQVFGLSETGCTALCLPTSEGSIARIEAGAVGRPYPGVEVRLDGDGAESGTLWIKSPANMLGYWNNPERTADILVDGWVNTGDIFERGVDGYFYIKGRSSEMIISGGVNVAPDEVDRIAESVPGVGAAACFEIPDTEFGALIGLAVIPSGELDEGQARKLKRAIAARYRAESESMARPSTITLVTEIPRTQSGKVIRAALAAAVHG
ncbi:putative fatty-acid--CoA ligase FadD10 [Mycolicibacterium sp. TY66]|uniref:fatty acid--CoA ligase FadD10 n=1 Tax=unclassified Mycolicibacterium TaxID=2636767 RepID=UPI001BB4597A|nr:MULTISPECIES: fatty acid--CoA ligase FadD10 [unclassified Mycolicibacterium]BCI79800.1 putative fatty-acid--CoA ligase FadD10 [Mycolicibacterium sp. TY66]BCJ82534.1 putative fatty-acid--CoA ligase FadD10 [Mycolicibacterium sp. TY81]